MAWFYNLKKGGLRTGSAAVQYTDFLNAYLPSVALMPLLHHVGESPRLVVREGDRVDEGQLVGIGSGSSARVHSSVPGIVRDFRHIRMPDGKKQLAVCIELDGSFSLLGKRKETVSWGFLPEPELVRIIEEKGVINTFSSPVPLAVQLRSFRIQHPPAPPVLLVRLFDEDPTYDTDGFLSRVYLSHVLEGAAVTARAADVMSIILVHNSKEWSGPDEKELSDIFSHRKVRVLSMYGALYPNGNRRELVNAVNAEEKKSPGIFWGDLMIDAVTAMNVYEAVVHNTPVMEQFVHVSGDGLVRQGMFKVRIGTSIGDLIAECGGFSARPEKIIINGLVLGQAAYDLDTPVTKYTKSLCVFTKSSYKPGVETTCTRCGECAAVCPVGLYPAKLYQIYRTAGNSGALRDQALLCEECAACSCVCPSRIPLFQAARYLKYAADGEKK